MESNGMFDKYLKGDKQFPEGTRELKPDEAMDDPEPEQRPEDEPEEAKDGMHNKHMEMMCQMIHMMTEMMGMFSQMLKSTPSKHKAPEPKADEYE